MTNAAGGIRRTYTAGTLMLISDHLNLTGKNPLVGHVRKGDERFPDMSEAYDRVYREVARTQASKLGIRLEEGVYAGLLGPSYETPSEVRMLERLGADAVGMSTVTEVIGPENGPRFHAAFRSVFPIVSYSGNAVDANGNALAPTTHHTSRCAGAAGAAAHR